MLNIASVNMPKIKPETKVLIIKNLKSKSPAEVADIFNGDVHDRPRKTTARDDSLLVRLTAPGGVDASDTFFVKNCMCGFLLAMVSTVVLLPSKPNAKTKDS